MKNSSLKKSLDSIFKAVSEKNLETAFSVVFWDEGKVNYGNGSPEFTVIFKTKNTAGKFLKSIYLGFGEGYIEGNIEIEGDFNKLAKLSFDPSLQNLDLSMGNKIRIMFHYLNTLNTLEIAKKNASFSYDVGNDFFKLFLDKSMAYTCAYYKKENDSLEQAQIQKFEHICRKLMLKSNDNIVDFGCGWGGLLIYAAKNYNVRGVGCTISKEQQIYASEAAKREKVDDKITFLCEDYRNIKGKFDKFTAIGLTEHIGKKFLPGYVKKIKSVLKSDGMGLIQVIGHPFYMPPNVFTTKYLWPGPFAPSLAEIVDLLGRNDFNISDIENLKVHYAKTTEEWSKRIEMNKEKIEKMYDKKFYRIWDIFYKLTPASFRYGYFNLYQITFFNGMNYSLPLTREHLYK